MPSMSPASSSSSAATTYPVRVLHKSEYKQAALSLAQAFKDDEVVLYPIKTADRKKSTPEKDWKLHLYMMECIVYAHCISGKATVIGPNYDCVALWYVIIPSPLFKIKKLTSNFKGWIPAPTWTTSAPCSVAACGVSTGSSPKKGVSVSLTSSCLCYMILNTKFLARMKPSLGISFILARDRGHVARGMLRR